MCTSILVGPKASADGSMMAARSGDGSSLKAQLFEIHEAHTWSEGAMYRTADFGGCNHFEWPRPAKAMRWTGIPYADTGVRSGAGFNEAGVGLSATETIFARPEALAIDPYVKDTGITEDDIPDILLPVIGSAREGAAYLGRIIETAGAGEGFGVSFVDGKELWYLETGTGHQWFAQRIPQDAYFASANQGRFQSYDPDSPDMMASAGLLDFARQNGFWDPKELFSFSRAYTRDDGRDRCYNDPRVWWIQRLFNPSLEQDVRQGRSFPLFARPEKLLSIEDVKAALRSHYAGTEHDPYSNGLNGSEPWRPVSVFRCYETHILQSMPGLPREAGQIVWVSLGMTELSPFIPFFSCVTRVPDSWRCGTRNADRKSATWKFRKLQTLTMVDYPQFAPIVREAIARWEASAAPRVAQAQQQYVQAPGQQGTEILTRLTLALCEEAEELAQDLTDRLFTLLTHDTEERIKFLNSKRLD